MVNPQFAVPVVGVVLCAVLVFAFGFKSPVQPPSFEFEHEEKRNRRVKKSKVGGCFLFPDLSLICFTISSYKNGC